MSGLTRLVLPLCCCWALSLQRFALAQGESVQGSSGAKSSSAADSEVPDSAASPGAGNSAPQNSTSSSEQSVEGSQSETSPETATPVTAPAEPATPLGTWESGVGKRGELSVFTPRGGSKSNRNYFFSPLATLFLPGFDQWWEGQNTSAFIYSGTATAGLVYAANAGADVKVSKTDDETGIDTKGVAERKVLLGLQTVQASGGMSAYHSFRTAVHNRKGQFEFLKYEESPREIMLAPFNYHYLERKTSYIPLGIGLTLAGLATLSLDLDKNDDMQRSRFTGADAFFSTALSYNAGTHEEAVFRGWLMPTIMEWTGSEIASSLSSAALFALAHLSTNDRPFPQFALGWYWGYLAQRNDWTISEGVFIHAWWDVIFFAMSYQFEKIKNSDKSNASRGLKVGQTGLDIQPAFWFPPLYWAF